METRIPPASSMHPMLWVAAISVTLLSFAGIASLTGVLPAALAPSPALSTAAPAYAPPAPPPAAASTAPEAPAATAPVVEPKPVKKKVAAHRAPNPAADLPPAAGAGVPHDYAPPPPPVAAGSNAPPCANCGVVSAVRQLAREGQGTGLGAVAGGVLGGVLGNNVGNGNGRTLATIAGAVGGGFLGNKVEKSQRETVVYQISVRMDDGTTEVIEAASAPSWRTGDQVRVVNGALVSR